MEDEAKICAKKCEVYSRVVGYYRPVQNWNNGKREEFKDRLEYAEEIALKREFAAGKEEVAMCECTTAKKA
jgi:hypothetical protein